LRIDTRFRIGDRVRVTFAVPPRLVAFIDQEGTITELFIRQEGTGSVQIFYRVQFRDLRNEYVAEEGLQDIFSTPAPEMTAKVALQHARQHTKVRGKQFTAH
jgi:hypothetical protein